MKPRILLVDDDEIVLSGLAEGLDHEGFETVRAASGQQALAQQADHPADLALTDLVMAEMDGLQLMRRLRDAQPDLPVIVITGHGSAENAIEALRQGASDYIQKPARAQEIAHRIRVVLDSIELRRKLSQAQVRQRREADRRSTRAERTRAITAWSTGLVSWLSPALDPLRQAARTLAQGIRSDDPLRREVQAVEKAIDQMDTLSAHLRRLANPPPVRKEETDLAVLLRKELNSESHARRLRQHAQTRFIASVPEGSLPVCAAADPLSRLLTGLIDAAFFALPRGGRIWLNIQSISRGSGDTDPLNADSSRVQILLGFSNPLDPEQIDGFFDPFGFLPDLPNAWKMGFTLSDAQVYARSLRVDLQVRALPKEGVEFVLRLPLRVSTVVADHVHTPPESGERGDILLVDDQPGSRAEARALLKALGYPVQEAESAQQAIDVIRARQDGNPARICLVLLDLVLGEKLDGADVARLLLDLNPDLRILLAGGFAETDRVVEARRLGVRGYLRKPFLKENLDRALRRAWENEDS